MDNEHYRYLSGKSTPSKDFRFVSFKGPKGTQRIILTEETNGKELNEEQVYVC